MHKTLSLSNGSYLIYNDRKQLHNTTGPAIYNNSNNKVSYYIDGVSIPFDIWIKDHCSCSELEKVELILTYGV